MFISHAEAYDLVRDVLRRPSLFRWTVQGLGQMRCYLAEDKVYRVNIYHAALKTPNVSTVHDHPWHFDSIVLGGAVANIRFDHSDPNGVKYLGMRLKTGEGGKSVGEARTIFLGPRDPEMYTAGQCFRQEAHEIHQFNYVDGTVTLNKRERVGDGEHAHVFWRPPSHWVSAKPRAATPGEVITYTGVAWGAFQ